MATKTTAPPTLGATIRALREKRHITQLALAHEIGWVGEDAGAQISRIEAGKTEPRVSTLRLIAMALDVPLADLLPG